MYINTVIITGRIAEPEFTFNSNGTPRLRFGLAVNKNYRSENNEWQQRTMWFNVMVYGDKAQRFYDILGKGDAVLIQGYLEAWSIQKEGTTRRGVTIVANNIIITQMAGQTAQSEPNTRSETTAVRRAVPPANDIPLPTADQADSEVPF